MKQKEYLKLNEFVSLVHKRRDLFRDIDIIGTPDEAKLLEDFCMLKVKRKRYELAWSHIIYYINENIKVVDRMNFLTEKTLTFLIDNKIALIELGHLRLSNDYLVKIYEKDNKAIESLFTIGIRYLGDEYSIEEFANFLDKYENADLYENQVNQLMDQNIVSATLKQKGELLCQKIVAVFANSPGLCRLATKCSEHLKV